MACTDFSSACLSVCPFLSLSVSLFLSISLFLYFSLSLCLSFSPYLSFVSLSLSFYSLSLSLSLSLSSHNFLPFSIFLYPFASQFSPYIATLIHGNCNYFEAIASISVTRSNRTSMPMAFILISPGGIYKAVLSYLMKAFAQCYYFLQSNATFFLKFQPEHLPVFVT